MHENGINDTPARRGKTVRFDDGPPAPPPTAVPVPAAILVPEQGNGAPLLTEEDRERLAAKLAEYRRRLAESDWGDVDLLVRAGSLCAELGQREEAVNMLQRAVALNRSNTYARSKLTELCTAEEMRQMDLPAAAMPLTGNWGEPFRYALRGNGPWMIAIGAIIFGTLPNILLSMGSRVTLALALLILLFGFFMLAAYLRKIIRNTAVDAMRASEAPEWPDMEDGIVGNLFKMVLLVAAVLAPAILWRVYLADAVGNPWVVLGVYWALAILGLLVLPMVLLYYCVTSYFFRAINPLAILGSIGRAGGDYWRATAIWVGAFAAREAILMGMSWVPFLGTTIAMIVNMYFLLVAGRALGLVYQSRQEQLGWY